jgi:hypothetical protein
VCSCGRRGGPQAQGAASERACLRMSARHGTVQ